MVWRYMQPLTNSRNESERITTIVERLCAVSNMVAALDAGTCASRERIRRVLGNCAADVEKLVFKDKK